MFCLNYLKVNQESSLGADESLPRDHTDQAADETQTQTASDAEPMTVHTVNCKLQRYSKSQ